jgi:tripartite-type tricarboxylate transporter receptor subunit TctC
MRCGSKLPLLLIFAAISLPHPGWGQTYPARPVRIIVGFAAGGPDTTARIIAQQLANQMGQPFVVDNRPGANGIIGTEMVAKGTADGGAGSACLGAWMRPGSGLQHAGDEPRSYACLHGRIPMNGAPAPRSGTPPDGHTLLHTSGSFAVNPSIYRKLPYDPVKDLAPISQVCSSDGHILAVNP